MTVTSVSTAMTSPTVPHLLQQQKTSRISNFSVDSLLADTRPRTLTSSPTATSISNIIPTTTLSSPINLKHPNLLSSNNQLTIGENHLTSSIVSPLAIASLQRNTLNHLHHRNQLNDSSSTTSNSTNKNERNTPQSSASAESDIEYDDSNADDDDNSIVDIEDGKEQNKK